MSGDWKSSPFDIANFSLSQWAETARVRHMTLPISRCPNVQRLREFTVWLCQFLGVPMCGDYVGSPFDFNNLSVMSGDCESSLFDYANFSVSQWAETVRVRRLTLPISPRPNGRRLREFAIWLCLFLAVLMSRDCESSSQDFANFSVSQWAETARVCGLTLPISCCPN